MPLLAPDDEEHRIVTKIFKQLEDRHDMGHYALILWVYVSSIPVFYALALLIKAVLHIPIVITLMFLYAVTTTCVYEATETPLRIVKRYIHKRQYKIAHTNSIGNLVPYGHSVYVTCLWDRSIKAFPIIFNAIKYEDVVANTEIWLLVCGGVCVPINPNIL